MRFFSPGLAATPPRASTISKNLRLSRTDGKHNLSIIAIRYLYLFLRAPVSPVTRRLARHSQHGKFHETYIDWVSFNKLAPIRNGCSKHAIRPANSPSQFLFSFRSCQKNQSRPALK